MPKIQFDIRTLLGFTFVVALVLLFSTLTKSGWVIAGLVTLMMGTFLLAVVALFLYVLVPTFSRPNKEHDLDQVSEL